MAHPSKSEIESILRPYHLRIREVVERAWSEWRSTAAFRQKSSYGPMLYSRTVANIIFDAIARNAVAEFATDSAVYVKFESQSVKFFFTGGVLARFKKGDDNKLGRNIPTQAALAFADPEWSFSDFPPETAKVEFIWRANEIQTRLEGVFVVARDGDKLIWEYEIEAASENVVAIPTKPVTSPQDDFVEELVKPKRSARQAVTQGNEE